PAPAPPPRRAGAPPPPGAPAGGGARPPARAGFLDGLNLVLLLGGLVSLVGAVLALWLVREHQIDRQEP
ncbi:hypothetical protein ACFV0O_01115, partial [Kitasatospora sp. NPDC059577]|uniref:hypothetical protein n=1 Tax=Kitasatospora sp. NPDC059577 TaxID=3346873 RepID=UPI00367855E8